MDEEQEKHKKLIQIIHARDQTWAQLRELKDDLERIAKEGPKWDDFELIHLAIGYLANELNYRAKIADKLPEKDDL